MHTTAAVSTQPAVLADVLDYHEHPRVSWHNSQSAAGWIPTWIFPATNRCSTVERSLSLRPAWCRPMPNCRLCCRLVSCSQHHEPL